MNVAIFAPFNPFTVFEYLSEESRSKVININSSATSVNTLVKSLLLQGHNITVITQNNETFDNLVLEGNNTKIFVVGVKSKSSIFTFFPYLPHNANIISSIIINSLSEIDIIHTHWTYEFALAAIKVAKFKPVVCSVRDWAPIIYQNIPFNPFYLYFVKKLFWIQKILIQKRVIKDQNIHLISNSIYTREKIESLKPASKIELIYNSINCDDIVLEKLNYPKNHTFVSICVSVDDLRKNVDTLIRAFNTFCQKHPSSRLIIIGKIHYDRKLYKRWKSQNLLTNIEFTGLLERSDILKILDNSTCMVHPAFEETFGNVILEGMARCIPIIGGENSGAVPHVLKYGVCGCLCDINSHINIYNSMLKIVEDVDYTKTIVSAATKVLLNEYSSEVVANKHIELYQKLIALK